MPPSKKMIEMTEEALKSKAIPLFVRTSSGRHNIIDVDQCSKCGVLEDPHLMTEDANGNAFCPDCA